MNANTHEQLESTIHVYQKEAQRLSVENRDLRAIITSLLLDELKSAENADTDDERENHLWAAKWIEDKLEKAGKQ